MFEPRLKPRESYEREATHRKNVSGTRVAGYAGRYSPRQRALIRRLTTAVTIIGLAAYLSAGSSARAASAVMNQAALADSLTRLAAGYYGPEPTVQQILDGLDYGISAANDVLPNELFCTPRGQVAVGIIAEYSGLANDTRLLWYPAGSPGDTITVLPGLAITGDSSVFYLAATDSIGWSFARPPSTTWFSERRLNYDQRAHVKFYPTPDPHTYLMFWEDLAWMSDGDFNDLVAWVRFQTPAPELHLFPPASDGAPLATGASVCLGIEADGFNCDGDSITVRMIEGPGTFDPITGFGSIVTEHCFDPPTDGLYTFVFEATGVGGQSDRDTVTVPVNGRTSIAGSSEPGITINQDNRFTICEPETLCVPFSVTSTCDLIDIRTEPPGFINIIDSTICFEAQTAAEFCIDLVAEDGCGRKDSTTVCFIVDTGEPSTLSCPGAIDTTLCTGGFVCFPVTASGGAGPVTISAVPPATYNSATGEVCMLVEETGTYDVQTVVQNAECPPETCVTTIQAAVNTPPHVEGIPDTVISACAGESFCFGPITCTDDENNLSACLQWDGPGTFDGTYWCYTPSGPETVSAVFRAADDCNKAGWGTLNVRFHSGTIPTITLNDTAVKLCAPDTVCVPFSIAWPGGDSLSLTLAGAGVLDPADSTICVPVDTSGEYALGLIATNGCGGADTARAILTAVLNTPPQVECFPPPPDTICSGDQVCIAYTLNDSDGDSLQVSIDAGGLLAQRRSAGGVTDSICIAVTESGQQTVTIIATDECGTADTCTATFPVQVNEPPTVTVRDTTVFLCAPEPVCLPVECGDVNGNLASCDAGGPPSGTYDAGTFCFTPDTAGVYTIEASAVDACGLETAAGARVTVVYDNPPVIQLADSAMFNASGGDTVCFDFSVTDADGNLETVAASWDYLSMTSNAICLEAVANDLVCARIIATDSCGLADTAIVCVSAAPNPGPKPHLPDTVFARFCGPGDVCIPFSIDSSECPPVTLSGLSGAVVQPQDSTLCLNITEPGYYETGVVVSDTCTAETAFVVIQAVANTPPSISCPPPQQSDYTICSDTTICLDIAINDPDNNIAGATASLGDVSGLDGSGLTVCVPVDTSGTYRSTLIVRDSCGAADTCEIPIRVTRNRPPVVAAPSDTTIFLCAPEQLCFFVACDDPDGNQESCGPVSLGDANWDGETLCFTPSTDGDYQWVFQTEDACGATDADTFRVSVQFNQPPSITAPADVAFELCGPDSVCVDFTVNDPDGGPLAVTSDRGTIDGDRLCVYRQTPDKECVTLVVTDSCGLADTAVVCITGDVPPPPLVSTPDSVAISLCNPGEVCFDAQVTHDRAWTGSVLPIGTFDIADTSICFNADSAGMYRIVTQITDTCGAVGEDTTIVRVDFNQPPVINLPPDVVRLWCGPGPVCVDGITASDPDGNLKHLVKIVGPGTLDPDSGTVCFDADTAGTYCFQLSAQDSCGAATVSALCVTLAPNRPPAVAITTPAEPLLFKEPTQICLPLAATDPDPDQWRKLEMIEGAGLFNDRSGNGTINATHCFVADTTGCYEFVFAATDSCGETAYDTALVCVTVTLPDSIFQVCIDTVRSLNGRDATVKIRALQTMEMGGFDFLVCYDPTMLNFSQAALDSALSYWEYFTYRTGSATGCQSCSAGVIRLVGIFDMDNGVTPPEAAAVPKGPMINMTFFVTPDRTFLNQCAPIRFCSYDCGDNTIASLTGDTLYTALTGVADSCLTGGKKEPIPRIDYCDGSICIIPPPDDRGDINLNGIAFEISDAVLFSSYFIHGSSVWDPQYAENQILATDVNCDGLVLSISDLVYLIRIITGDEQFQACPDGPAKVSPVAYAARIVVERREGALDVDIESGVDLGGVFVSLESTVGRFGSVEWDKDLGGLTPHQNEAQQKQLRAILVAEQSGAGLSTGRHHLFTVPWDGSGEWTMREAQASTFDGHPVTVEVVSAGSGLPSTFELEQNHPNPFNAGTIIRFRLGEATNWQLTIFNVLGQAVRRFEGTGEAGSVSVEWDGTLADGSPVASGIYFARLKAADFTATRKMVLLK